MAHWRTTASHGWLVLSPKEQAKMPTYLKMHEYEEDCDWAIPVTLMPELLRQKSFHLAADADYDEVLAAARDSFRSWNPHLYWKWCGDDCADLVDWYFKYETPEKKRPQIAWHNIYRTEAEAIYDEWIAHLRAKGAIK